MAQDRAVFLALSELFVGQDSIIDVCCPLIHTVPAQISVVNHSWQSSSHYRLALCERTADNMRSSTGMIEAN